MIEKSQILHSEADTEKLADQLALKIKELFNQNNQYALKISLEGNLGAGKTTLTRYLLKALGHAGKVKSPTYTLCEPYEVTLAPVITNQKIQTLQFHHFDLYRMNYPEEWIDAGFRDTLSQAGICLIEWAEKAGTTLPPFDLIIQLQMNDDETRSVELISLSKAGQDLLA